MVTAKNFWIFIVFSLCLKSDNVLNDDVKGIIWFKSLKPGSFISNGTTIKIIESSNGNKIVENIYKNSFCVTEFNDLGHLVSSYSGLLDF